MLPVFFVVIISSISNPGVSFFLIHLRPAPRTVGAAPWRWSLSPIPGIRLGRSRYSKPEHLPHFEQVVDAFGVLDQTVRDRQFEPCLAALVVGGDLGVSAAFVSFVFSSAIMSPSCSDRLLATCLISETVDTRQIQAEAMLEIRKRDIGQ